MNNEKIKKLLRTKELIKTLDSMQYGESLFVENDEVQNVRSLYLAMHRRGKKVMQSREADGYILTIVE